MRQPHPELNFRMGKGRFKTKPKDLIAAMRFVGMTDKQIKEKLLEIQKEHKGKS